MPEALVIPGLIAIDPHRWDGRGQAEIVRGALAGKADLPELSDWKRELWLIPREVARRLGVRPPEERAELSPYPRLRGRLAEAALVVVDEATVGKAAFAGYMTISVSYHRVASGGSVEVHDGEVARGFSGEYGDLLAQVAGDGDAEEGRSRGHRALERAFDRVLRALTGGALSLYDVDFADFAAHLRSPEFAGFEAELAEIEAQGAERRPLAESLLAALDAAADDEVALPGGYVARRVREPDFTLRPRGVLTVSGGPIAVPADERWLVDDVEAFMPAARKARIDQSFARHRSQAEAPRRVGLAVLVAVVVVVSAVLLLR
ncbi:hypothetical protein [Nannocystis sp. SCPEA4]|uniref:hypothetical protein n=1 Tax=Nannocystis sp. SCPEA4 TaxID=2996787 RepID=UPI00226D9D19|nr:hypothetical protein [Nannocystis sp. SCPEA4]MCY1059679.1 hypothetical protein [Nannocystis sp. SCPEA4]